MQDIKKLREEAFKNHINLDYIPEPVADISLLSIPEWKELRKRTGIGASEVAKVMGMNVYGKNILDVYRDHVEDTEEEIDAAKQYLFDYGHAMEPVVANYFSERYRYKLLKDDHMYRHPLYEGLFADPDYFVFNSYNRKGYLEIKTSGNYRPEDKSFPWKSGIYGRGGKMPEHYLWQLVSSLAVYNLFYAWIVVAFDNNPSHIIAVYYERDFDLERRLLDTVPAFWKENVLKRIPPEAPVLNPRKKACKSDPGTIVLPEDLRPEVEEYVRLADENTAVKKIISSNEDRMTEIRNRLIEEIGENDTAVMKSDEKTEYQFTYKPVSKEKIDLDLLKFQYPDIYNQVLVSDSKNIKQTRMFRFRRNTR